MPVITRLYPNIYRIICEINGCMYIQFQVRVHWLQSNYFLFFMRNVLMLVCVLQLLYLYMFCCVWHLMLYSSNYQCSSSIYIFWHQSPSCTLWLIIVTITISIRTQMFSTKAHTIQTTEQHKYSTPYSTHFTLCLMSFQNTFVTVIIPSCAFDSPPFFFSALFSFSAQDPSADCIFDYNLWRVWVFCL